MLIVKYCVSVRVIRGVGEESTSLTTEGTEETEDL